MRILHTSDWHLGRTFHGVDLRLAQQAFVDHIVDMAIDGKYDAVLLSGDVYDRAIPPIDALRVYGGAVDRLADANIRFVVSSGNHDSFHRLGQSRHQLERLGIHVRTYLEDATWPINMGECVIYAIPYLEPSLFAQTLNVRRTAHAVISRVTERIREHARTNFPGVPIVVMAHAFVTGAEPSDSERDINVGGVGNVGATAFDGVSYAALGHLHRPQVVRDNIVYSGSPLPYSFGEARTAKSVREVVVGAEGVQHRAIELPKFVGVHSVECSFEDALSRDWSDKEALVELKLNDEKRVPQALQKLKEKIPHLIRLQWVHEVHHREVPKSDSTAGRTDSEVFREFMSFSTGHEPTDEQMDLFHEALRSTQA